MLRSANIISGKTRFPRLSNLMLTGALSLAALLPAVAANALTAEVQPTRIPITFGYHGATLTVSGESAPTDDIVVKISTEPTDTHMKCKTKVGGVVWMKKGGIEFKGLPLTYMLYSTAELTGILDPATLVAEGLGYEALNAKATLKLDDGKPADHYWFEEFIKLKEKERLYSIHEGTVVRHHGATGNQFQVTVDWPYQAQPHNYNVEVLAVRDGLVVERASTQLLVEQAGLVAALSGMATKHAALYGIMAVIVALAAGLGVGAIFKKGGGSH